MGKVIGCLPPLILVLMLFPTNLSAVDDVKAAKSSAKVAGARQLTSDTILVSLPSLCFGNEREINSWKDTVRLFQIPTTTSSDLELKELELVRIEPDIEEEETSEFSGESCFARAWLVSESELVGQAEYRLLFDRFETNEFVLDASLVKITPGTTVELDRTRPYEVKVRSPFLFGASSVKVTGKLAGQSLEFDVLDAQATGEQFSYEIVLTLGRPIAPRTALRIEVALPGTNMALGSPVISGTGKFPAPKSKKESEVFAQLNAEAEPGEKTNLVLDFKLDEGEAIAFSDRWTFGLIFALEASTKDSVETNKLKIEYPFTHTWVYGLESGSIGALYTRLTPRLEGTDIFANRNVMGELSVDWVDATFHGAFAADRETSGNPWRYGWKYAVTPTVGYQWGENQRLESEKLREFEGYSVSRAVAELAIELTNELPDESMLASASFTIEYAGWYRLSRELDTFVDSKGDSKLRLRDGFAGHLTLSLELNFTETLGFVVKYQNGERPALFENEDKLSLGISLRY